METPISVLTNLAYIAFGVLVMRGRATRFPEHHWRVRTLASWLVGLSFVALGVASASFHWLYDPDIQNWPVTQIWDERGMYLAFSVLAGVLWDNVGRQSKVDGLLAIGWEKQVIPKIGLALGVTLAATAHLPWSDSMYVMPALALLCIGGVGVGQSWGRALRLLIAFVAIAAIRELPESNFWQRDPLFDYDLIHGGWHLFTALWMYYLYKSTEVE